MLLGAYVQLYIAYTQRTAVPFGETPDTSVLDLQTDSLGRIEKLHFSTVRLQFGRKGFLSTAGRLCTKFPAV